MTFPLDKNVTVTFIKHSYWSKSSDDVRDTRWALRQLNLTDSTQRSVQRPPTVNSYWAMGVTAFDASDGCKVRYSLNLGYIKQA